MDRTYILQKCYGHLEFNHWSLGVLKTVKTISLASTVLYIVKQYIVKQNICESFVHYIIQLMPFSL